MYKRQVVDGALVCDGLRVDVDDAVTVVVDRQASVAGQVADDCGLDVPLVDDLEEALAILRGHDRHHAFLGLAHEDLARGEGGVAQEHVQMCIRDRCGTTTPHTNS